MAGRDLAGQPRRHSPRDAASGLGARLVGAPRSGWAISDRALVGEPPTTAEARRRLGHLPLQAGLFDDSPRSCDIVYNMTRLRALRAEVDVKLALGQFTLDQAADYLPTTVPVGLR